MAKATSAAKTATPKGFLEKQETDSYDHSAKSSIAS
mgnify:CR=1 FL=1